MPPARFCNTREEAMLAFMLAFVAGCVDAIGYLALARLFTANMSGNTAGSGALLGARHWYEGLLRCWPIPFFFAGCLIGALLLHWGARRGVRRLFSLPLTLETILLVAYGVIGGLGLRHGVVVAGSPTFMACAVLGTVAMGLQNEAWRRVGTQPIHTTYVSGMLQSAAEALAGMCFGGRQLGRDVALLLGIFFVYWAGAVLGGVAQTEFGIEGLALPLVGLLIVIGYDRVSPIKPPEGALPTGSPESMPKPMPKWW